MVLEWLLGDELIDADYLVAVAVVGEGGWVVAF